MTLLVARRRAIARAPYSPYGTSRAADAAAGLTAGLFRAPRDAAEIAEVPCHPAGPPGPEALLQELEAGSPGLTVSGTSAMGGAGVSVGKSV